MKLLTFTAIATMIGFSPAMNDTVLQGHTLAEYVFSSCDVNGDSRVDMDKFHNFGEAIFDAMDADESAQVSGTEYLGWGYGFQELAKDTNHELAYRRTLSVVFSF